MGYHFYNPHKNKVYVAHHAKIFENRLKYTRSEWEFHFAKSEWEYCRTISRSRLIQSPVNKTTSGNRATKGIYTRLNIDQNLLFLPTNSHVCKHNLSLHDDDELSPHDDASWMICTATNKRDAPAKPPQIYHHKYTSTLNALLQKDDYNVAVIRQLSNQLHTKPRPKLSQDHPLKHMEHRGIFDSGCSGHMTGNRAHLEDYQELSKVGSVTFGGSKGSISGKGTIRLGNLVFDDVAFVKELGHFNLFSISQICDKKLNVLFTEKECFVVSSDFKMPDENQVLLKVPRQHNMYTFDMKNVASSKGYTCLLAKASSDEAKLWHRRLGHLNFKNLNKLVKDNLVRGLPSKSFKNDHTCVACQKGKQHKASCKAKIDRYVTHPLHTLHMDLFGPTSVRSINHTSYCLVITDDYTRFCWISQEQAPSRMPMDDLLQAIPKLISRIDSLEMDLKQTKLTMGNAIVKSL
ncbi:putative ribonuclease H-like domain-containing protein [Tanacetum coccineum]